MAEFSSPIAGGLRIRRTRVSSFSFLNRPQEQQREDFRTTLALQQNRLAFDNINTSITNLTNQVTALNLTLQTISQQMTRDSALDQAREAQKVRQEQILAEQKLREGKESVVERKMQSALLAPVRKVGAKARFTLGRLANFFMILLGGFLGGMAIDTIGALITGNKEKLEQLKKKFLDNIGIVSGILLLISGGFTTILGYLTRLTVRLGSAAFRTLLVKPVQGLLNLVKNGAKGVLSALGLGVKPPAKKPPAGGGKPTRPAKPPSGAPTGGKPGGGKGTTSGRPSSSGTFRSTAGITFLTEILFGSSFGESGASTLGAGAGAKTAQVLSNIFLGNRLKNIKTAITLIAAFTGSQAFKNLYQQSNLDENPVLGSSLDIKALFSGDFGNLINTPNITDTKKTKPEDIQEPEQGGNVTIINNELPAQTTGSPPTQQNLGSANYLPKVSSSNVDNFYLLYSMIQYNVAE